MFQWPEQPPEGIYQRLGPARCGQHLCSRDQKKYPHGPDSGNIETLCRKSERTCLEKNLSVLEEGVAQKCKQEKYTYRQDDLRYCRQGIT